MEFGQVARTKIQNRKALLDSSVLEYALEILIYFSAALQISYKIKDKPFSYFVLPLTWERVFPECEVRGLY